jgi:sulfur carrier protein ThiS
MLEHVGIPVQYFLDRTAQLPTRLQGIMVAASAGSKTLAVNVNGNIIPARYYDGVTVQAGDPVAVEFVAGTQGQAEAWVTARLAPRPRPAQGTVTTVPPASSTITVTGSDGVAYTAGFASTYTPAVGDNVILSWSMGIPNAIAKVGYTPAPAPVAVVSAPPPPTSTGTNYYAAVDTSTYWGPGGWDSWAGGNSVYQGDYGSGPLTGAWFYGGSPTELAGRTVTGIRFTLGARNGAGASSSPVTVNLYTHTSARRPGGNVTLAGASTTVVAQPWQGGVVYGLPTSFATDLLNGGGICITGGAYAGFKGRNLQADSGLLAIDWSR